MAVESGKALNSIREEINQSAMLWLDEANLDRFVQWIKKLKSKRIVRIQRLERSYSTYLVEYGPADYIPSGKEGL